MAARLELFGRTARCHSEHGAAPRWPWQTVRDVLHANAHAYLDPRFADRRLDEICNKERIAPFETPALLVGDERILVQVVKDGVGRITSMKLDGTDARDFTKPGEGLFVENR